MNKKIFCTAMALFSLSLNFIACDNQNNESTIIKNSQIINNIDVKKSQNLFKSDLTNQLSADFLSFNRKISNYEEFKKEVISFISSQERFEHLFQYDVSSFLYYFYYFNGVNFYLDKNIRLYVDKKISKQDNRDAYKQFKNFIVKNWYFMLKHRNLFNWIGFFRHSDPMVDPNKLFQEVYPNEKLIISDQLSTQVIDYYIDNIDVELIDEKKEKVNHRKIWVKYSDGTIVCLNQELFINYQIEGQDKEDAISYFEPTIYVVSKNQTINKQVKLKDFANAYKSQENYQEFTEKNGNILTYVLSSVKVNEKVNLKNENVYEKTDDNVKKINILDKNEFIKQDYIQTILNQYFAYSPYINKTEAELKKEKEQFIYDQIYDDEKVNKTVKEFVKVLNYYSIPKSSSFPTDNLIFSLFNKKKNRNVLNKYFKDAFLDLLDQNWLTMLYLLHYFEFIGTADLEVGTGGDFGLKYSTFVPWTTKINSNKIDDLLIFTIARSYEDENGKSQVSPFMVNNKEINSLEDRKNIRFDNFNFDYKYFNKIFYLKVNNRLFTLTMTQKLDSETNEIVRKMTFMDNKKIYVLQNVENKKLQTFALADIARYFTLFDIDSYAVENLSQRKRYVIEGEYGNLIPYYIAGFLWKEEDEVSK
ncbi:hypothetical protein [Mesomycoplasma lagogenitalium]|uniref:Lipoprotein n=1 Tax=Mesomycoplasma lagogenitalium TaxID=171286 RepID=A0ABY8LXA3_9BACT|nr:hypothetical protein [Mesomycoplasma lagogenitalium]WGI36948.1 hypothetical protein QEG99_01540 [Mesomycoplasma lagogenitalium]